MKPSEYRKTFLKIDTKPETDERILNNLKLSLKKTQKKSKNKTMRFFVLAAAFILMSVMIMAIASGEKINILFGDFFGDKISEGQTEILNNIYSVEEQSITSNGTTITMKSVIYDGDMAYIDLLIETPEDVVLGELEDGSMYSIFGYDFTDGYSYSGDRMIENYPMYSPECFKWNDEDTTDNIIECIAIFDFYDFDKYEEYIQISDMLQDGMDIEEFIENNYPLYEIDPKNSEQLKLKDDPLGDYFHIEGLWIYNGRMYEKILDGVWDFDLSDIRPVKGEKYSYVVGNSTATLSENLNIEVNSFEFDIFSLEIKFKMTKPNETLNYLWDKDCEGIAIILKDGTYVKSVRHMFTEYTMERISGDDYRECTMNFRLDSPLPVDEIMSVQIGETRIPVTIDKEK